MGSPWVAHRARAEVLSARYPHAAEMLTVYLGLIEVWEDAWRQAGEDLPALSAPSALVSWAADRVAPAVVKATEASAPASLAAATRELLDAGELEAPFAAWLGGGGLDPVERYLARAS